MLTKHVPLSAGLGTALLLLSGCATLAPADLQASQPYCLKNRIGRTTICTKSDAPSMIREAEVKRFAADPARLTIFVVRNSWGDTVHRLRVSGAGEPAPELIPRTFARMTLQPGEYTLSFELDGRVMSKSVQGKAGDIVFASIDGTAWAWGSQYAWSNEPAERTRDRVLKSRLVSDR